MRYQASLEIHFYSENEVAVRLEGGGQGIDPRLGEVLLFTLYAVRQMCNLGPGFPGLDQLLMTMPGSLSVFAHHEEGDLPRLVEIRARPGAKRFVCMLLWDGSGCRFNMKPQGFGFLARGVGYYAPVSVTQLLRYLALARQDDNQYVSLLEAASRLIGETFQQSAIRLSTQMPVAIGLALKAYQIAGYEFSGS